MMIGMSGRGRSGLGMWRGGAQVTCVADDERRVRARVQEGKDDVWYVNGAQCAGKVELVQR